MSIFKKILHFIGGKPNGDFNDKGTIENTFSKQQWKKWEARFLNNAQYNWRSHSGSTHTGLKKDLQKQKDY
ncbi:MAG: hypothetical protein ACRBBP_04970 [Bdellovibrionales bacterium]